MDRHAKLSRLRYLLNELVEQLKIDTFEPTEWKETCLTYQEINQVCDELDRLPLFVIEADWVKAGRLTTWRPNGPPPILIDIRATKQVFFNEALWKSMRKPEVVANLQRWVRFCEHLTSEVDVAGHGDAKGTSWSELMTIADLAKQFGVKPRTINRWKKGETVGPVEVKKVGTRWQYRHRSE